MQWVMRAILAVMSLAIVANGGYWEWHHRIVAGAVLVVAGLTGVLFAAGANTAHGNMGYEDDLDPEI